MVTSYEPLTSNLALVAGAYVLAGGIALNRMGDGLHRLIDGFEGSLALGHLSGLAVFACGAALVLMHNIWTSPLAALVSLLGWIGAIKGMVLIAWPAAIWALGRAMARPSSLHFFKFATPLTGLALLAFGLSGRTG